jgi:hypothetical protein
MSLTSLKNKNVIKELEKIISPILVVNNSALKPYVELFEYSPENIYQQPLGSLVGFFEVKEFSDESAYIVNFLTSVLKKEYYINPKRPVTESLDSALHKVNMALSELAKHGNVEWLGKINAAICVLEKNNTHFSVAGDAKIFLYRNQALSEISEDLASDSLEPHPLKTFVNVSSGRLEKDDRLIITSADIFHILTILEIKKNLQRFEGDKFVQFLKTALSNQIEMIASIVVEIIEPVTEQVIKSTPRKKSLRAANAFSEQTFSTVTPGTLAEQINPIDLPTDDPEYTDEKTGHIYVQGETMESQDSSHAQINLYWDMVKEKISQGSYQTKNEIRKRFSLYKKQLAKKKELRQIAKAEQQRLLEEENKRLAEEKILQEIENEKVLAEQREFERIENEKALELEKIAQEQELANEKNRQLQEIKQQEQQERKANVIQKKSKKTLSPESDGGYAIEKKDTTAQSNFMRKLQLARMEQQRNNVVDLSAKNKLREEEREVPIFIEKKVASVEKNVAEIKHSGSISNLQSPSFLKKILPLLQNILTSFFIKAREQHYLQKITPHFSRIGKLFSKLSGKQKLYTIGALLLIFIVPIFIANSLDKPAPQKVIEKPVLPLTQAEILAKEKNINLTANTTNILPASNTINILIANNAPTLITNSAIIVLQNNSPKEFPIPLDYGRAIRATYMNDLSLIFIFTDSHKIISFSPISTKFNDNKIDLSDISSASLFGTYLTYLYILDQKTNQIYRYPRSDGGFGERTKWLKDSTPLSQISDMTIDENIYAVANNEVIKLFKGQKQAFSLENSNTSVQLDKIYTSQELNNIYILDKKNSRIVQYNKEGLIIKQYFNETIKDASTLAADETNKTIYVTSPSGLSTISM